MYIDGNGYATSSPFAPKLNKRELPWYVTGPAGAELEEGMAIYRGGSTLEMSAADLSNVNKTTGLMKERGLSLNTDKFDGRIQKFGGAYEVDLSTIPDGLKIKWTSGTHYEITPLKGGTITVGEYQNLLKQVKLKPFNTWNTQ